MSAGPNTNTGAVAAAGPMHGAGPDGEVGGGGGGQEVAQRSPGAGSSSAVNLDGNTAQRAGLAGTAHGPGQGTATSHHHGSRPSAFGQIDFTGHVSVSVDDLVDANVLPTEALRSPSSLIVKRKRSSSLAQAIGLAGPSPEHTWLDIGDTDPKPVLDDVKAGRVWGYGRFPWPAVCPPGHFRVPPSSPTTTKHIITTIILSPRVFAPCVLPGCAPLAA